MHRYIDHMPKMVQIRNMPDDVHRQLKSQAAAAGLSLSEYLLREVTKLTEGLSLEELVRRARLRGPVQLGEPIEDIIREMRGQP
jgi:plasmid stability protein